MAVPDFSSFVPAFSTRHSVMTAQKLRESVEFVSKASQGKRLKLRQDRRDCVRLFVLFGYRLHGFSPKYVAATALCHSAAAIHLPHRIWSEDGRYSAAYGPSSRWRI
jgi:hypothetical protein